jgi:hypothetical protein
MHCFLGKLTKAAIGRRSRIAAQTAKKTNETGGRRSMALLAEAQDTVAGDAPQLSRRNEPYHVAQFAMKRIRESQSVKLGFCKHPR